MHYKYNHAELFKDVPDVDYAAFDSNIVIYGAGFQGLLAAHLLKKMNINVICFADQDKEKQKNKYYGLPVISPSKMIEEYSDSLIIVTPYVFEPVYQKFKNNKLLKNVVLPVPLFLEFETEGFDELPEIPNWYRSGTFSYYVDMFLRKCCNVLTTAQLYAINVSVSQLCNLRCKNCTSLMPNYKTPKHFRLDDMIRYMDIVSENRIFEYISVEGGEPFLWPELPAFLNYLCSKDNIWDIILITNGTIIPGRELLDALKNPKIKVRISDYGAFSKLSTLSELFDSEEIKYLIQLQKWSELSTFTNERHSAKEFNEVIEACCKIGGRGFTHLADGKIFCCPIQGNLHNTGIYPSVEKDYVDLNAEIDQTKIEQFLLTKHIPELCWHCKGRGYTGKEVPPAEQLKKDEQIIVRFE